MSRSKAIFVAFIGKAIKQTEKIFEIEGGYECWDLKQFTLDEFIGELKKKVPPVNAHVLRNYRVEEETGNEGLTEANFKHCSWGLVIPETIETVSSAYDETLYLLNLYSPNFLYPYFYASDMGIMRPKQVKDPIGYFHSQDHSIFQSKKFVAFYKILLEQAKYGNWNLDHIQTWDDEDWRLFAATLLFKGLEDYDNSKSPFGWQRESAEMAAILEALLTAGDIQNEEVTYRLRKRIAVLLSWKFPDVEKDIKKLYGARSAFVHGSFFKQIAKESPSAYNNIPVPDFDLLYKHKEYVRFALAAYLNLAKIVKSEGIEGSESVMDALEKAIINTELRNILIEHTKVLFALVPEPKFNL